MWLSEANAAPHESSDSCQAILLTMPCTIALRLSASLPSLPFTVWPCRLPRYLPAADSLLALYPLAAPLSSAHLYLLPATAPAGANATSRADQRYAVRAIHGPRERATSEASPATLRGTPPAAWPTWPCWTPEGPRFQIVASSLEATTWPRLACRRLRCGQGR